MQNIYKTGYRHPDYAKSLDKIGSPLELRKSGGWILKRKIPASSHFDGIGCYPLFSCVDWTQLEEDLEPLGDELVSLCVTTDPFGDYSDTILRHCFPDVVFAFKTHFVVDLSHPIERVVNSHHQRNARKALKLVNVKIDEQPIRFLEEFTYLYSCLIKRHNITGVAQFSPRAFAQQIKLPGIVTFRSLHQGATVGMLLWFVQSDIAYYHLGAYSELGYKLKVSFALFWRSLEHFAELGIRWLNLGGGSGLKGDDSSGLSRFKRGWSTGTRIAYFCGRIYQPAKYAELTRVAGYPDADFFPAYRIGEFT